MSSIVAIKGFNDILPTQTPAWRRLEQHLASLMDAYGYQQIRLPIVEQTNLFKRSIGDATDIVEKEMYTFLDKGQPPESLTLRPEGTAGCVRAMLEHNLLRGATPKVWYVGPMFRYEKPQKGRYRQFHQFGVETFGVSTPDQDAELILMTARLWKRMGVADKVQLELNTLGESDERANYRAALVEFLQAHKTDLDEDSQRRLTTNPLRILDSKDAKTQSILENAPKLHDFMGEETLAHFAQLQQYLTDAGVSFVIWVHKVLFVLVVVMMVSLGNSKVSRINLYQQLALRWGWSAYCFFLNKSKTIHLYVIVKSFWCLNLHINLKLWCLQSRFVTN